MPRACHFIGFVPAVSIVQGRTRQKKHHLPIHKSSTRTAPQQPDSSADGSGFALLHAKAQAKEQTG
jgi:hypothetical protein